MNCTEIVHTIDMLHPNFNGGFMNTATLIKDLDTGIFGTQKLWLLDPPLEGHKYVVSSESDLFGVQATNIFLANEGHGANYSDFKNYRIDRLDHDWVIKNAGYTIVKL